MRLLIENACVITVDRGRRVLDPGSVLVDGARIAEVGEARVLARHRATADRVIDGRLKLVMPGFVSTHTHVGYTVFRGRAEDAGLTCVYGQYFPMGTVITREERAAIGSFTYAELLRSGVTTVLEMEEDADVYAPFVERLGIRSAMGVMIHDAEIEALRRNRYRYDADLRDAQLEQAARFAERWHGRAEGRITALVTPNMTISSSPELLRGAREAADRLGLRLSVHLGWGTSEVETISTLHGTRPAAYLMEHGLLGPDVIAAHCYVVDESDLDLLARTGTAVAHCPLMNAVRGQIAPVTELRRRDIGLGLGIDNMFADFFDVLRQAVLVARIRERDSLVMPSLEAIELATMGGARSLGLADQIGSIEPGKRADLLVLDVGSFGLTPLLEPAVSAVYHAHAGDVEMVLVDGRVLVEGKRLLTADAPTLAGEARAAAASAWSRFAQKYGGYMAADHQAS